MSYKNKLIVGKTGIFAHCDMGEIEVEIKAYAGFGLFYVAKLKRVYFKNARILSSAMYAQKMVVEGKNVDVFVEPHTLIKYDDSKFN